MPANPNDPAQQQLTNTQIRRAISDAYNALQAQVAVQSAVAYTFDNAIADQIQLVSGTSSVPSQATRPNQLQAVQNIVTNLNLAVKQILALPDDAFADSDPDRDVNTPSVTDEDTETTYYPV
jgi:hypothetical protein